MVGSLKTVERMKVLILHKTSFYLSLYSAEQIFSRKSDIKFGPLVSFFFKNYPLEPVILYIFDISSHIVLRTAIKALQPLFSLYPYYISP